MLNTVCFEVTLQLMNFDAIMDSEAHFEGPGGGVPIEAAEAIGAFKEGHPAPTPTPHAPDAAADDAAEGDDYGAAKDGVE